MNKMNMSYSPSKSEIYLLTLLAVVAVIALSFNYFILPQWNALGESFIQFGNQTAIVQGLRTEYSRLDTYRQKESELSGQLEGMQKTIPAYFSEEELLAALDGFSASSELSLPSIAFGGVQSQPQSEFVESLKPAQAKEQEASKEAESGESVIDSERVIINYLGSYAQLKGFLETFEDSARKVYFRSLTVSRGLDGILNGTMNLLAFSSTKDGGAESYPGYTYAAEAPAGKDDPFEAFATGTSSTGSSTAAQNPDFYIVLNTYDDNSSKILMGAYPASGTQLTSDQNGRVQASLTLSQTGTEYRYSYTIDGQSRSGSIAPKQGKASLEISILSRARKSSSDLVGMTLSVKNETDLPVNISVSNDDAADPRFALGTVSGTVRMAD